MSDKFTISGVFLNATTPLLPKDAVAAIIVNEENQALLQLRDDKADIFFPHHWGCFGGAMEPGETPHQTLLRELHEEVGIAFDDAAIEPFIQISFNPKVTSKRNIERYFFIVRIQSAAIKHIRLGEGSGFDFFSYEKIMGLANVTPYDKVGLWLYFIQNRLVE